MSLQLKYDLRASEEGKQMLTAGEEVAGQVMVTVAITERWEGIEAGLLSSQEPPLSCLKGSCWLSWWAGACGPACLTGSQVC